MFLSVSTNGSASARQGGFWVIGENNDTVDMVVCVLDYL